uniref:Ankyrin-3 n=1 Tax=Anthurium amnicola TaxID=1678845 RepID=A0A1D1YSF6_9ARAE
MTVFGHPGGGFRAGKVMVAAQQVFPVDYEAEVSQRLVEAAQRGDLRAAMECLSDPYIDVNYAGAVWLRGRRTEVVLHEEAADEVRVEHEELRTDVSALFLAAHAGNLQLARKLLNAGADVNQKLFRGFAMTAAAREGRTDLVELLLKAGASQPACEEALLEACSHGRARLVELLMGSDLIRHQVAVHALVLSCCRGFADVVEALMKCGVDANATDRLLLRSMKPSLHTNVDCTALVAAVVSRQKAIARLLLQAGVRRDTKVRLGGWSWDTNTGEEFRVGAGLAEPYGVAWCAVEYFESSGTILRMLLQHHPPDALHNGRALLHHAILCANPGAVDVLLDSRVDIELPVKTHSGVAFRPIHMAARLGLPAVLHSLIRAGCDIDSRTDSGETALMLCARYKRDECLRVLAAAGADFGLTNSAGMCPAAIATSTRWGVGFQQAVLAAMHSGTTLFSSDRWAFSPMMFASRTGDVRALQALLAKPEVFNIDEQDGNGYTPVMITAKEGHVEAFRCLVFAGADVKVSNKAGETAITLSQLNKEKRDLFEEVMLEFALEAGVAGGFYALHCAARRGDSAAVRLLTGRGYDVNVPDEDGYTPLMLAAREGHGPLCELLVSSGARCDVKTHRGETALSLARLSKGGAGGHAEQVILDELSRGLALGGAPVKKHTKCGKGSPHGKVLRMVAGAGVLRWGQSGGRNVVCRVADVGPSSSFQRNRRGKADAFEAGMFRVVTTKGREIHFVCDGGDETAQLWVRGIRLVTGEALGMVGGTTTV